MHKTRMSTPKSAGRQKAPRREPSAPKSATSAGSHTPRRRSGVSVTLLLVFVAALLMVSWLLGRMLAYRYMAGGEEPDVPAEDVSGAVPVLTPDAAVEEPEEPPVPAGKPRLPGESIPLNEYDPDGFVTRDSGQITYAANGLKAIAGVDVSEFQGDIDWKQVKASGMDFAMIRVGLRGYGAGGNLVPDRHFEQNITEARKAGLKVGVYFFSQAINEEEAREEARFVLDALAGRELDYPVVFDWERITNGQSARTEGLSGEMLTRCARAFCETVAGAGYTPGVYFNQLLGYLSLDLSELAEYSFWLASYSDKPDFYYHFDMWQYTAKGLLPGIQGYVDLNLSFRDFAAE